MQRSYRDVLCGITGPPVVPKTKRNKKKRCKRKCKKYDIDYGCWSFGKCYYYHKPLFNLVNSTTVFECTVFGCNSKTNIVDKYLVTTKNGVTFQIFKNGNYIYHGIENMIIQVDHELWEIYDMFSDARWDDDYHWCFDADFHSSGKDVVWLIGYLRKIAATIKKIFLIRNIKELHPDIVPRIIQSLFKDMEHPQYSVYPFYID